MKIKTAKFFQTVKVPGVSDLGGLKTSIDNSKHDVELVDQFIKITYRPTGESVFVTVFNTSWIEPDEQATIKSPASRPSGTGKAKSSSQD